MMITTSNKGEVQRSFVFIRIIFTLTKFTGTFRFQLSQKNELVEINGIFYVFLPILLSCVNFVHSLKYYEEFSNEEYFAIVVQIVTHLNCAICVLVPFFNKTRILFGINTCLIHMTKVSKDHTLYPFSAITFIFILWTLFNFIKPIADGNIFASLLFLERFILGLLEIQMCFLLCFMKETFFDIRENIKNRMECEIKFNARYFIRNKSTVHWCRGSLESYRKQHLTVYKAMKNFNTAFGLINFMLTIRERFSFAYYLYCWISTGEIFNMILAIVNFIQIFPLFYSFQMLKNEENKLKHYVKELDQCVNKDINNQLELLKKQTHLLTIKFEACGLFSMDLNMVISIITTTAGYLLLLNQLNL